MNRVFVMLTWHAPAGAAIFPVGVLGIGPGGFHVSWVPLTYHRSRGWRTRLHNGVDEGRVAAWLAEAGTEQLAEVTPAGSVPLRKAVEAAMDELLAGVLPGFEA